MASQADGEWVSIHEREPILHQASFVGNADKIRSLMKDEKHRKLLNNRNRLGCTPLRLAATAGHTNCVLALLSHGADPNIPDVKAQTPLFVAVKNQHPECCELLLKWGAKADGDPQSLCTPLYIASMDGHYACVVELVRHGADMDSSHIQLGTFASTPLYISIAYHHFHCFREMLLAGANPECGGQTCAVKRSTSSVLTLGPPQVTRQSLFHAMVKHNVENEYAQLLYDCGASLYMRNEKDQCAHEMEQRNECLQYILALSKSARSLVSCCRLAVRRLMGKKRLGLIPALPLPRRIVSYLQYAEYTSPGAHPEDALFNKFKSIMRTC